MPGGIVDVPAMVLYVLNLVLDVAVLFGVIWLVKTIRGKWEKPN